MASQLRIPCLGEEGLLTQEQIIVEACLTLLRLNKILEDEVRIRREAVTQDQIQGIMLEEAEEECSLIKHLIPEAQVSRLHSNKTRCSRLLKHREEMQHSEVSNNSSDQSLMLLIQELRTILGKTTMEEGCSVETKEIQELKGEVMFQVRIPCSIREQVILVKTMPLEVDNRINLSDRTNLKEVLSIQEAEVHHNNRITLEECLAISRNRTQEVEVKPLSKIILEECSEVNKDLTLEVEGLIIREHLLPIQCSKEVNSSRTMEDSFSSNSNPRLPLNSQEDSLEEAGRIIPELEIKEEVSLINSLQEEAFRITIKEGIKREEEEEVEAAVEAEDVDEEEEDSAALEVTEEAVAEVSRSLLKTIRELKFCKRKLIRDRLLWSNKLKIMQITLLLLSQLKLPRCHF